MERPSGLSFSCMEIYMKLRSASFPGSKVIHVNGDTVYVTSDDIKIDGSDNFTPSFDATYWTDTQNRMTVGTDPMELTFQATGGGGDESYLELDHPAIFSAGFTNTGNATFRFGFDYEILNAPAGDVVAYSVELYDTTNGYYWKAAFIHNDNGGIPTSKIVFSYNDATHLTTTSTYIVADMSGDYLIDIASGVFTLYNLTSGEYVLVDSEPINLPAAVGLKLLSFNPTAQAAGVVSYRPFEAVPTMTTPFCKNITRRPILESVREGFASFRIDAGSPGSKIASMYGSGSSAEILDSDVIEVIDAPRGEDAHRLLVSNVEEFYLSGGDKSDCPTTGAPADGMRGTLALFNDCCFCDGSDKDLDELKMKLSTFASLDQYGDRVQGSVNAQAIDELGKQYGQSFEFNRIHHHDATLAASLGATEKIQMIRQLNMSDGKVAYYGMIGTAVTSTQVLIGFSFTWSPGQIIEGTGGGDTPVDEFSWELWREGGTAAIATNASAITVATVGVPGNLTSSQTLFPGRYYVKIKAAEVDATTGERAWGARIDCKVAQGTLISDPVMAEGFTYVHDYQANEQLASALAREEGVCYVNFEVQNYRAKPFVYIYDRCNDTMDEYISNTLEVSTRTMSMAAFENDDNDVVVVYQYASDDFLFTHRATSLSYRTLDVSLGTWSSRKTIELPKAHFPAGDIGDSWNNVYAFDLYRLNNRISLFISREANRSPDYQTSKSDLHARPPFTPIGDRGVWNYLWKVTGYSFDGTQSHNLKTYRRFFIPMASMGSILTDSRPNQFTSVTKAGDKNDIFPATIRVNYNEDFKLAVLSSLDESTRMPFIMMGKNKKFEEINLPHHFSIRADLDAILGTAMTRDRYNTSIDSLDAALCADGMIYSVASKEFRYELGVNDPEMFWDTRQLFYEPEIVQSYEDYNVFRPDYRFDAFPILSLDNELAVNNNGTVVRHKGNLSISSNQQYITVGIGDTKYGNYPMLYLNGQWEDMPFETTPSRIWTPELEDDPSAISHTGAVFNAGYAELQSIGTGVDVLTMLLTDTSAYHNHHLGLDEGVKWHFRIEAVVDGVSPLTRPIVLGTATRDFTVPPDNNWATTGVFVEIVASFEYDGDEAALKYFDSSGTEQLFSTVTGLDHTKVYDFYIIAKRIGQDKARITWVIKDPHHVDGAHSYDFKSDLVAYQQLDLVTVKVNSATEQGFATVQLGEAASSTYTEYVRVYEIGMNLLRADSGLWREQLGDKGGGPDTTTFYVADHFDSGLGRFRQFDDTKIFEYQDGSPQYDVRLGYFNSASRTSSVHWYNGFLMRFSDGFGFKDDEWSVKRTLANSPNLILSKNIAGLWVSSADTATATIYADAQDSGLESFRADSFVVTGANVDSIKVVGKVLSGDAWTVIGTIDLEVFKIKDPDFSSFGVEAMMQSDNSNFDYGRFEDPKYYVKEATGANSAAKVVGSIGDQVLLKHDSTNVYAATEASVLTSRGVLKLDAEVEYRYMGFQIEPYETYEGYFTLTGLDFGVARELPVEYNHSVGTGLEYTMKTGVKYIISQQAIALEDQDKILKVYKFVYKLLDGASFLQLASISDDIALNRRPVWVLPPYSVDRHSPQLCLIDSDFKHKVIKDEDGVKYYEVSITLQGVDE